MAKVKRCFLLVCLIMAVFTIGCSGGGGGPKDLVWDNANCQPGYAALQKPQGYQLGIRMISTPYPY